MQAIIERHGYKVIRVEPDMVDTVLPMVQPFLQMSLQYASGFETIESMVKMLRASRRNWQLWAIVCAGNMAGAFITTIDVYERQRVMTFEILAGLDAREWIDPMVDDFEKYMSATYGITLFRIAGPAAWSRWLKEKGYSLKTCITEKRVEQQTKIKRVTI